MKEGMPKQGGAEHRGNTKWKLKVALRRHIPPAPKHNSARRESRLKTAASPISKVAPGRLTIA